MLNSSRRLLLYGLLGVLSLGLFVLDWVLPAGLTVELMQVAIVLLTLFVRDRRPTFVFGGVTTLFVGTGFAVHLYRGEPVAALINHGIVLFGIWMAVAVVLGYKHVVQARRESEARAQAVLDTTLDGILTVDAEGTIKSFNPAAETLFGYDAGEVVGTSLPSLLAASDRERLTDALRTYRETGRPAIVGTGYELQGRRRDGSLFPIELSISEVEMGEQPLLTVIVRDITERKKDERRLATQYHTAHVLTGSDSLTEAAPRILETICEHLDWERGELWLPTPEGQHLESVETWQATATTMNGFENVTHETTFALGEGLPGRVWEDQRPHWLPDVRQDDAFKRTDAAKQADMRAGFAFPIRIDDTVLGVMVFFSHEIREPDEGLLQMFSVIGNQIGQFAERRQTEKTLQTTAERLSRAQKIASLGSWEYDLTSGTMVWSEQMYRLFGVDPDAFSPSLDRVLEFLPENDRTRFEDALEGVHADDSLFRLEHRLLTEKGGERWVFTQAEVQNDGTRLVGATLDTTELKRTKKALEESEARAQAILETTVDGIITIDRNGIVESFNQAAEDIFGYDASEVVGENVKMLMPSPYHEEHDEYLRNYHETGNRNIIGIGREVTGKRKDGSTFPMDLAVSEVELGDRTIYTGIVRDISERRRLEKEILNVSEEERRRIGQDLHDGLGQMLTGIGLLSQDVARQLDEEGHERAEDMAEITEHVKEADQYARDLSHGLIPVDVEGQQPSALPEALRRLSKNAERLFSVECDFQGTDSVRIPDNSTATHLYRIAQEAVNNAVRHGDADRLRIILAAGDEQIRLQVRDDGSGFEEDDLTDAGMGVRIMNYRARIIGGTLDLNSALGDGTVVTCTLPRTESPIEDPILDEQNLPSA
ncbi:PAS domain S-box protein [Salinibacter sp. 10B]|uniref:PAS domain S-box protein n=1 Tax=Salinibacter sp. 10B TaxID=1923971 RepID=UPI000CF4B553|nr:PAS domain S-box protein [Salinibacter sp. 10B]